MQVETTPAAASGTAAGSEYPPYEGDPGRVTTMLEELMHRAVLARLARQRALMAVGRAG